MCQLTSLYKNVRKTANRATERKLHQASVFTFLMEMCKSFPSLVVQSCSVTLVHFHLAKNSEWDFLLWQLINLSQACSFSLSAWNAPYLNPVICEQISFPLEQFFLPLSYVKTQLFLLFGKLCALEYIIEEPLPLSYHHNWIYSQIIKLGFIDSQQSLNINCECAQCFTSSTHGM